MTRLRCQNLDLVQLHGLSYTNEDAKQILGERGAVEALEQLKKDGVIRFIGFTTEDNNRAVYDFFDSGRFDMVQMCYNFLFQHPYEPSRPFGSLFEAEKRGLGISVMATGIDHKNAKKSFDFMASCVFLNANHTPDQSRP